MASHPPTVQTIKEEMRLLEIEIADVKDRLLVLEGESCTTRSSVEEAHERLDKVEDRLDKV